MGFWYYLHVSQTDALQGAKVLLCCKWKGFEAFLMFWAIPDPIASFFY